MQTCFHLYLPQRHGLAGNSARGLRDNVILLRRVAAHGAHYVSAATECDIPEEVRNRTDYRLVVTCPALNHVMQIRDVFNIRLLLEMEYDY